MSLRVLIAVTHGVEQSQSADEIVREILARVADRFPDQRRRGHVDDGVTGEIAQGCSRPLSASDVDADETRSLRYRDLVAFLEVVEDQDVVAVREQDFGHNAANVAGAARYRDAHGGASNSWS